MNEESEESIEARPEIKHNTLKTTITYYIAFAFLFAILISWWNEVYLYFFKHAIKFFHWQGPVEQTLLLSALAALVIYMTRYVHIVPQTIVSDTTEMSRTTVKTQITYYIAFAFLFAILLAWWNVIYLYFFRRTLTDFQWQQPLQESILLIGLAALVIYTTRNLIMRLMYLEGFLPVCASCKKIRVNNVWIPIDVFIHKHTEAKFSHGMCDECMQKFYGEYFQRGKDA